MSSEAFNAYSHSELCHSWESVTALRQSHGYSSIAEMFAQQKAPLNLAFQVLATRLFFLSQILNNFS